jgi:hypothetical protein
MPSGLYVVAAQLEGRPLLRSTTQENSSADEPAPSKQDRISGGLLQRHRSTECYCLEC